MVARAAFSRCSRCSPERTSDMMNSRSAGDCTSRQYLVPSAQSWRLGEKEVTASGHTGSLLRRHYVGMAGHFLPAAVLFHPHGGKAKTLRSPGVRHFSAEDEGLVSGHNHRVPIVADVFDLPVVGSERQKPGLYQVENLLLVHK